MKQDAIQRTLEKSRMGPKGRPKGSDDSRPLCREFRERKSLK